MLYVVEAMNMMLVVVIRTVKKPAKPAEFVIGLASKQRRFTRPKAGNINKNII